MYNGSASRASYSVRGVSLGGCSSVDEDYNVRLVRENGLTWVTDRMKAILATIAVLALFGSASAHLCMLQPKQRGSVAGATSMPDDPVCGYTSPAPCGPMKQGPSVATYQCGSTVTVSWVKNANHWNPAGPGNFTLTAWMDGSKMVSPPVFVVEDTNTTALSRYSLSMPIDPYVPKGTFSLHSCC